MAVWPYTLMGSDTSDRMTFKNGGRLTYKNYNTASRLAKYNITASHSSCVNAAPLFKFVNTNS